jgi:ketosteroid isomerase-like protein
MEFREVGGCVVVAGRLRVVASVGAPLDLPAAFVFKIADGRITRMEGHMTLAQAVASAERMP